MATESKVAHHSLATFTADVAPASFVFWHDVNEIIATHANKNIRFIFLILIDWKSVQQKCKTASKTHHPASGSYIIEAWYQSQTSIADSLYVPVPAQ